MKKLNCQLKLFQELISCYWCTTKKSLWTCQSSLISYCFIKHIKRTVLTLKQFLRILLI
ncbi:DUF1360 domain-containing protein [Cytobacillus sp. AMY 15.2]|uniref:DUF1360 domain-containing protein n=1 Tax=unclassified Cytobacillus TaxID=2675268 RepID=UPI001358BB1D